MIIELPGGTFPMGSDAFYPEEGPVHEVTVQPFGLERAPVTNAQFAEFVDATGYVTLAEQTPDPADFPGADPDLLVPGSLVFTPTDGPVDLRDWRQWWRWVPGTSWREPRGPGSSTSPDHPVVQVSYDDAVAYADWAGKRLPTEAEFEYAARAGRDSTYAWGEEPTIDGALQANTWQGRFPHLNTGANGWVGTSPVGSFPANDFGFADLIGNVWEWTQSPWTDRHSTPVKSCCAPSAPTADPQHRRVIKGGSHLCAPEYCLRYRPAARSAQTEDSATSHIGFRLAVDL